MQSSLAVGSAPLRILVIEDNPTDLLLMTHALKPHSNFIAELVPAASLKEAAEELKSSRIDAILLDLNLLDSSGVDSYRNLRKAAPALPVVVVTGRAQEKLALELLREGAQDYIVKEPNIDQVLSRSVRFAIERQRARLEQERQAQRLREGEQNLRLIIEASADAMVIVDKAGKVLFTNPAAKRLLGRSEAEIIGSHFGFPVVAGKTEEVQASRNV